MCDHNARPSQMDSQTDVQMDKHHGNSGGIHKLSGLIYGHMDIGQAENIVPPTPF